MSTEDLRALRGDIIEASSREHRDFLDELSSSSLRMLFNRVAPEDLRIGGTATLRVHLGSRRPTSREISRVTDAFSAAVASIGHDIRRRASNQDESKRVLNASDYRKTPVYVQASGGNLIVMRPEPPEFVDAIGSNADSTSARAIDRLANLLPESRTKDELLVVREAVGADRADRYALRQVAQAARATRGLEVEWEASGELTEGFISQGHADELVKVLDEVDRFERVRVMDGRLDGTRVKRRQFWLERSNGDIDGVVDEELMSDVLAHIDEHVTARIIETTKTTRSGKASRPSYRLVGLSAHPKLNAESESGG